MPSIGALVHSAAVLVGRAREARLLDRLVDDARAGRSSVLALVGEAGVGKSALLDDLAGRVAGVRVLRARGVQSEADIPFAALYELLRPALDRLDALAPPQRTALEGALALRPASARDRFATGAATLGLLTAWAEEEPLLVLVDDAQWIDGSSAEALRFACRRLVADPITVLLSVRAGEPSLIDDSDIDRLVLRGLDRDATARLLAEGAGERPLPEGAVDRLHRSTGGNPLVVLELAGQAHAVLAGPELDQPIPVVTSVGKVYLERCAGLPGPARDLLLLAAASDRGALSTLARAAHLAGLDLGDLAAAEATGLVSVSGDRVEFRHPLARSAVYAAAPAERRRAAHRALAGALPDADADRRAWHLALAALGPDEVASSALAQAAERARARSAYHAASHAFERASALALDDERRAALLHAAADAAWTGGLADRALVLLEAARHAGAADEVGVAVEQLRGHIATRLGPVGEGYRILLEGAERAAVVDPDRAVTMLAEAVNAAFYGGDARAMRSAAARIAPLVGPALGPEARFFATMAQGMSLIFSGDDHRAGAALVRDAMALVDGSVEPAGEPRLLVWAVMGSLWLREADRTHIAVAHDAARHASAVGVLPFLLSHVALDAMAGDRWSEAAAWFHEAIDLARETGQRTDLAAAVARLAWLEARQGREAQCREHAAEARALASELDLGLSDLWATAALGELELALGHHREALGHFERQRAALLDHEVGDVDLSPEPELVEVRLRLGHDPAEVVASVGAYEREATAKGQAWALARAARCRGLLASDDELDDRFGEALAHHAGSPDVFETARTRLAYGARLRRARRRKDARQQLGRALETFEHLGAQPWADAARGELAATGATARRRDPSTRNQLTPQELQISMLLAEGRTTREAAATLFLSPKTIEYHLRSVYRKLGISSREELAAHLAKAGPGTSG